MKQIAECKLHMWCAEFNTYLGRLKLLNSAFDLEVEFIESHLIHEGVFLKFRSQAPFANSIVKFRKNTVSVVFIYLYIFYSLYIFYIFNVGLATVWEMSRHA